MLVDTTLSGKKLARACQSALRKVSTVNRLQKGQVSEADWNDWVAARDHMKEKLDTAVSDADLMEVADILNRAVRMSPRERNEQLSQEEA